jgi:hypothetical protein
MERIHEAVALGVAVPKSAQDLFNENSQEVARRQMVITS